MKEYQPTIGLEIHAELKTKTKMFCACANDVEEKRPNHNICPVCMAHPGALPVINKEAVRKVLLVGRAVGATLADYTEFDRKSYFYPDIPKGYQISQYAYPLVQGGTLNSTQITRIHLEEDTARSQHEANTSLVDYNRAGVPLMELVTEPTLHSALDAGAFARELQLLLRYLKVGDANMEKGEMRVEANISVSSDTSLGTKVEVKNLNSFRSVERAIAYEVDRQTALLEKGERVVQETRGWDENKQITFSQRKKESSHDYRYFPDPDLPKLLISEIPEFSSEILGKDIPELPWQKRERYIKYKLAIDDADMFVRIPALGIFFDSFLRHARYPEEETPVILGSNYLASDIAGKIEKGEIDLTWLTETNAKRFAELMNLVANGKLSSRGAKNTLTLMFGDERNPEIIAQDKELIQQSDESALALIVKKVIETNPTVVTEYMGGKTTVLQFLVGQGMKETKGAANPETLREQFVQALK